MKTLVVVVVVVWCCVALGNVLPAEKDPTISHEQLRLIEMAPGKQVWMTFEQVLQLVQPGLTNHFFDVTDFPDLPPKNVSGISFPPQPRHQEIVNPLLPMVKAENLRKTIEGLSAFFTRYYNSQIGKDAAIFVYNRFKELSQGRSDVEVEFFQHTFLQPSVIARVKGKGDKSSEVVVLGAHEDSISNPATGRAPGCDDDASGTAAVLEVFKILIEAKFQPERTIEFHAYAGEEVGLLGSQAIANHYRNQGINVVAMMQFDMTSYLQQGATPAIALAHDFVNPDLTQFVGKLIDTYCTIGWEARKCGYACSDHASWTRVGFASSYTSEGIIRNPNIHTPKDTLEWLDMEHGAEFPKLGIAFVIELSLTS